MLSNLVHFRPTSGRPPADLQQPTFKVEGAATIQFTTPLADLQQTRSPRTYHHLRRPRGPSWSSSGRFLSLYRTFQSADFERLLDLERSLDLDLSLDLLRDLERDLDLLLSPPAFLSFLAADFERDLDLPRPLRRLRVLQLYQRPLLLLIRRRFLRLFR